MYLPKLYRGILIKRYKRFMADIRFCHSGEILTVHTPNSGSMKGLQAEGTVVYVSYVESSTRKYPYTWELVQTPTSLVGIHTGRCNTIAQEGIVSGKIVELQGYQTHQCEVPYGEENSRIDFLLSQSTDPCIPPCYVEVKNVTLEEKGCALFPDAVTTRGQKHLRELIRRVEQGFRGVMLYIVQRMDCDRFSPAEAIDPQYFQGVQEALNKGVEILIYGCTLSLEEIYVSRKLAYESMGKKFL